MKLAFAIATIAALQQPAVTHADCDFGSNYTKYINNSVSCPFDVGFGAINTFSESNTISSGDTNVTTNTYRGDNIAIWKMGDKDSTVQCYSNVSDEIVYTDHPNGSTFKVDTGDFPFGSVSDTVADGVALSFPGLYYFKGGRLEKWMNSDGNGTVTKAEGDISLICVKSSVVQLQLQLRLPRLQLRKLLAVDQWLL